MQNIVHDISNLLHEASETHHVVFKIVDGEDKDWASWYSEWLINLSRLPDLLRVKPVKSELTYMLVKLDKEFTKVKPRGTWEAYYAKRLVEHFS